MCGTITRAKVIGFPHEMHSDSTSVRLTAADRYDTGVLDTGALDTGETGVVAWP